MTNLNLAFSNSGIGSNAAAVSVGIVATNSEFSANAAGVDSALQDFMIGYNRDILMADVVVVLSAPAGQYCGWAKGILPAPVEALTVVASDCFQTQRTLQHEVGHLLGLHHNWAADQTDTPGYSFAHGYRYAWNYCANDLMAVGTVSAGGSCAPGGQQVYLNYYSNPTVFVPYGTAAGSYPTGNRAAPHYADSASVLISTVPIVATYRNSKTSKIGALVSNILSPFLMD
jgi:hypothetical protein